MRTNKRKTGLASRNWTDSSISLDERHAYSTRNVEDACRVSFLFPIDLGRRKETARKVHGATRVISATSENKSDINP